MLKREIYSVVFNKFIKDGTLKMYIYTLGVPSTNEFRKPAKIEIKNDRVIITFEDNSRHIIGNTPDVEIFDREIKPIKDDNRDNNINKRTTRKRKDSE